MGAHNREQKHPNRYTRPGIADSRCVPCSPRALSAGRGKKLTATGFDMLVTAGHAPLEGQGLRAGSAVRHVEHSTFDFRSGIIRAEIMGDDWPRAPFEAERGLSPRCPYAALPRK